MTGQIPTLQQAIDSLLVSNDWRKTKLAAELGISRARLNNWVAGNSFPNREAMCKLHALGISAETLIGLGEVE